MEILDVNCRFCLIDRARDVRMLELDESIEQLFYDLTQVRVSTYHIHLNMNKKSKNLIVAHKLLKPSKYSTFNMRDMLQRPNEMHRYKTTIY